MYRYIYVVLLVLIIVLLWRPLGLLGIAATYLIGLATIACIRRLRR